MKKLLIILAIVIIPFKIKSKEPNPDGCLKANIFFVVDWSESIKQNKTWSINPILNFLNDFNLNDRGVKIGIILFGSEAVVHSRLTSNEEFLISKLEELKDLPDMGNTSIEFAFPVVADLMAKDQKERNERVLNLVIVISDGGFNNELYAKREVKILKENSSVVILSLLIKSYSVNEEKLEAISDEGCYFRDDYPSLVRNIKRLDLCL